VEQASLSVGSGACDGAKVWPELDTKQNSRAVFTAKQLMDGSNTKEFFRGSQGGNRAGCDMEQSLWWCEAGPFAMGCLISMLSLLCTTPRWTVVVHTSYWQRDPQIEKIEEVEGHSPLHGVADSQVTWDSQFASLKLVVLRQASKMHPDASRCPEGPGHVSHGHTEWQLGQFGEV
jgi:hypothetical protein